jgi:hypothetical protein
VTGSSMDDDDDGSSDWKRAGLCGRSPQSQPFVRLPANSYRVDEGLDTIPTVEGT